MNTGLPRAMLFDLDDTILAFSDSADPTWERVCRRLLEPYKEPAPELLLSAIEESRTWFWNDPERHRRGRLDLDRARREIVADAFRRIGLDDPVLATRIADSYSAERDEAVEPFPGAIETLSHLRDRGVRLGLITNGSADGQRRKIEKFGLQDLFDYILVEGEFGAGKPDARVYQHALDQLRVKAKETWMIGDNLEWDVEAPQRLGIFAIWMDFAGRGLPASTQVRPDRTIRSLSKLLEQ